MLARVVLSLMAGTMGRAYGTVKLDLHLEPVGPTIARLVLAGLTVPQCIGR